MTDHADTIRRSPWSNYTDAQLTAEIRSRYRTSPSMHVHELCARYDALLAERRQLQEEVERLRDRAVCSGCGSDVDEGGICNYAGCDDGQMIPASDLPTALREACDAQGVQWAEWVTERDELSRERRQAIDALREALAFMEEYVLLGLTEAEKKHRREVIEQVRAALMKLGEKP